MEGLREDARRLLTELLLDPKKVGVGCDVRVVLERELVRLEGLLCVEHFCVSVCGGCW